MKTLDIIIPVYNVENEVLIQTLNSIQNQKNIDFEEIGVIIVDDFSKSEIDINILKNFSFEIQYYRNSKNCGAGITRQNGLDKSKALYVTFLDSDDEFIVNDSFSRVFESIKTKKPNVIITDIIQQYMINNQIAEMRKTYQDFYSLHGLFINRQYLSDNNYQFHPELRLYEDFYFCNVLLCTSKCTYIKVESYLWKYNPSSLTLKDGEYIFLTKSIDDHFISIRDGYKQLKNRNCEVSLEFLLYGIYSLYCVLESNHFNRSEMQIKKNKIEKKFYDFISKNNIILDKCPKSKKDYYYNQLLQYYKNAHPNLIVLRTYDEFISRLRKKYKK